LRPIGATLLTTMIVAIALTQNATVAAANDRFGINAQELFWLPQTVWPLQVQEMRQDGIQVARTDADWDQTEPQPPNPDGTHVYQWADLDTIVNLLATNKIRWQPILDYSAGWDASRSSLWGAPNLYSPPGNNQMFADYARALVQRYGAGGAFWGLHPTLTPLPVTAVEIWNEENSSSYWQPQPDAGAYAALYEAARSAIHSVDPTVQAIVGGLLNPGAPFLQNLYGALGGSSGRIDAVGMHPYGNDPVQDMYPDIVDVRSTLDQHGDINVPIDITEFGWATQGGLFSSAPIATEQQRAQYITQFTQTVAQSNCGVDRILPHTWVSKEQDPNNAEDWFGLVHPDGTRRASESAYSATILQLEAAPPPSSSSASVCARQLGVQGSSSQPPPSQPLLPLLSAQLRPLITSLGPLAGVSRRHAGRTLRARRRAPGTGFTACAHAVVTSYSTPVDAAHVTFLVEPGAGLAPSRVAAVTALTDSHGTARGCWRSLRPGGGIVKVSATRPDFGNVASTRFPIRWGASR
jgi:hypothetical protein